MGGKSWKPKSINNIKQSFTPPYKLHHPELSACENSIYTLLHCVDYTDVPGIFNCVLLLKCHFSPLMVQLDFLRYLVLPCFSTVLLPKFMPSLQSLSGSHFFHLANFTHIFLPGGLAHHSCGDSTLPCRWSWRNLILACWQFICRHICFITVIVFLFHKDSHPHSSSRKWQACMRSWRLFA